MAAVASRTRKEVANRAEPCMPSQRRRTSAKEMTAATE